MNKDFLRNALGREILEAKDKPEKTIEKYLNDSFKKLTKHNGKDLLIKKDAVKFEKASLKKGSKGNTITINVKDFPIHTKGKDFDLYVKDESLSISEEKGIIFMDFLGYRDDFSKSIPVGSADLSSDIIVNQIAINCFELVANLFISKEVLSTLAEDLDDEGKSQTSYIEDNEDWANNWRDSGMLEGFSVSDGSVEVSDEEYFEEYLEEKEIQDTFEDYCKENAEARFSRGYGKEDMNLNGEYHFGNTGQINEEEVQFDEPVIAKMKLVTDEGKSDLNKETMEIYIHEDYDDLGSVQVDGFVTFYVEGKSLLDALEEECRVSYTDYVAIKVNLEDFNSEEQADIQSLADTDDLSLTELQEGSYNVGKGKVLEIDGNEYSYFYNLDDAEDYCKEYIKDMIDTEGVMVFNYDFVMQHIDTNKLGRDLSMDGDFDYGYDEPDNFLDEEREGEDGDWSEEQRQKAGELADDSFNKRVTEDPIGYLEEIYGSLEEWGNMENYIDEDSLIEEAINVDGVAHFIATYDGEEKELTNGVAYRTN